MYDLNRYDLEEILKFVNFCMINIKKGNLNTKDLLMEMLKIFRSYDAQFFPSNNNYDGVDLSKSISIKEKRDDLAKYINHYWRYDPLYSVQFSPEPNNRVFKTDDIIPYSQLKKLDYYREYLQSINWFGELVIRLCNNNGFWGAMSISRSPKQPHFNRNDVSKAKFLLPYLIHTFEATTFLSKIKWERKLFEQWLESSHEGIIFLDTKLQPVMYNRMAKKLCHTLSGLKPELLSAYQNTEITLPQSIVEDCRCLVNLQDSNTYFSHNRIIKTKNGQKYYIKYKFIHQIWENNNLPCLVIYINELAKNDDEAGVIVLRICDLSEREETIAHYTGLGMTNKEIGKKLGISQFTVQSHLRNIFEKMGIKSRAQLANLVK
jgi:DNA-binding CsgD family transcriptional regulator